MFITLLVTLYTSRVILHVLGVVDYGIYNVVGGIVAVFGFLNSAMVSSTQRYMSYELGKNNIINLNIVFNTSFIIHLLISIIIIILAETVGLWLMHNKMVIPEERFEAALWVYHISIITFVLNIIRVPDNSMIIAYEHMNTYAYISIIEVILKLLIVFILQIANKDKLVLYAILLLLVTLITNCMYRLYCRRRFEAAKFRLRYNKLYFSKMFSFSGWSLLGNLSSSLSKYGVNILLNMFFGPTVNAARGVAFQVQAAVVNFSSNFIIAANPQIIKSYATKDYIYLEKLINSSSKLAYYLLYIVSLPILLNCEYILKLWLSTPPDYSKEFVCLVIVNSLIDVLTSPIQTAVQATGKIKYYQIITGGILLFNLPISYILLKIENNVYLPFFVGIILSVLALMSRFIFLKKLININVRKLIYDLFSKITIISIISLIVIHLTGLKNAQSFTELIINCLISCAITGLTILLFGLNKNERKLILSKLTIYINKK